MHHPILSSHLLLLLTLLLPLQATPAPIVISPATHHLGNPERPEYDAFRNLVPHPGRLDLPFISPTIPAESTLLIRQDDVKLGWRLELNGKRLAQLVTMEAPLIHAIPIPANLLLPATNILSLIPPTGTDDIFAGPFLLHPTAHDTLLTQATVRIQVTLATHPPTPAPCRLTLLDHSQSLAPLLPLGHDPLAVRPGVVYTANGAALLGLMPGHYTVHATRGPEYSLASATFHLLPGEEKNVQLQLDREMPTPGWVACDPHTHTVTYSGHGDASVEERVITLAGEGIELPIATDHNTHTDYSGFARKMGVAQHFTPVIGNEVTTKTAHFNIFPILPDSPIPDHKLSDWNELFSSIRSTPGVQVTILNHPHNIHNQFQPFNPTNFNPILGLPIQTLQFHFDAIELVNSSALQSDPLQVFEDWFAILNSGKRLVGVGSSDVHDVSRYIVGQGRTYIRTDDRNPGAIDVNDACRSLLRGRALVSMGLLANLEVDGRFGVGELATGLGQEIKVTTTVLGPSWITASRVELFANGVLIRSKNLNPQNPPKVEKAKITWTLPKPSQDVHLICRATGPGITNLFWNIPRPYQPASTTWNPLVFGCTNPIWIDADNDATFTSARDQARSLVARLSVEQTVRALASLDAPTAAHAASFIRERNPASLNTTTVRELLRNSPPHVRQPFL